MDAKPVSKKQPAVRGVPVGRVTHSNVEASTEAVTLLAANKNRLAASITNDAAEGSLYVKLGAGASDASFMVKLGPEDYFELPQPVYPGEVTGIWSAAAEGDAARVTETT